MVSAADESSTLLYYLEKELGEVFNDPTITEIAINRPGEYFTESSRGWERFEKESITYNYCMNLANALASLRKQDVSERTPALGGQLPNGERCQIVMPPACEAGTVSITIRKPTKTRKVLADYDTDGSFSDTCLEASDSTGLDQNESHLLELYNARQFTEFLRYAVLYKKNIVMAGATGSGKTTISKAISDLIPENERIITIEDTAEIDLPYHKNRVHLFYSKDGQGISKVTPKQLLESCLRMKPDRILLSELRSDEAYYYLRNVNSGHPGSITTIHADSAKLAFTQLMLLIKDSKSGSGMTNSEIYSLLYSLIDVVAHWKYDPIKKKRVCTGIFFDPMKKREVISG